MVEDLLNPKENYPNEVKVRTQEYLESVISSHSQDCGFFFKLLHDTPSPYVKFWSLSALEKIITSHYQTYDLQTRAKLRVVYFDILEKRPDLVLCDAHIEHKYALLFILLVRADYPSVWPDAFLRLMSLLKISCDAASGFKYLSFVMSAMIEFDREIVEQSGTSSKEAADRRREIKDRLRADVVAELAVLLQDIIANAPSFKASGADRIVAKALEVMEKLIDWTNPELFVANLPYLTSFLKDAVLQTPSAKCIYSFIYKGMEPLVKLQLIDRLNLIAILSEWEPSTQQDTAFSQTMAIIVNKVGMFLLDCAGGAKESIHMEAASYAKDRFATVLALGYKCLDQESISVSLNVVELLNHYLAFLKRAGPMLNPVQAETVNTMLLIVFRRIEYPNWYALDPTSAGNTLEEMYNYFRSELSAVLGNLLSLPGVQATLISRLTSAILLWKAKFASLSIAQKEVPLFIFYKLGECVKDVYGLLKTGPLGDIMGTIMSVPEIFFDHYVVMSTALDVVVRYAGYFELHSEKSEDLIRFFLSEK